MALPIPRDKEILWLKLNLTNKLFVIGTVYKPPKMKITHHLEDCLEFLKQTFPKSGIIIQADFNIQHGHWLKSRTTDAKGVALLDLSHAYGLELVEFDIYFGPHGSSWLNVFLTDHSHFLSVESYPHVAVMSRGNIKIPQPVKHEYIIRQYHHTDWEVCENTYRQSRGVNL